MTEQDILDLIECDEWMMEVIRAAAALDLPDWIIGAGFVRNKIWDHLHGYARPKVDTNDIDLVYFDPHGNDENADELFSKKLKDRTGINWEIVNEAYAHQWSGGVAYVSTEDAISRWPETATAIGVTLKNNTLKLTAPYGISDLTGMIVRPSPKFTGGMERVRERAAQKRWSEKYPKLRIIDR
jgi:hypothetical protein